MTGLGVALWIVLTAIGLGRFFLRRLKLEAHLSALEQVSFSGALGLAFLSYSTFLLGALHLWYPLTFALGLAGLTAFLIRQNSFGIPWAACRPELEAPGLWQKLWRNLALSFLALFFLAGFFPEIFFDALHYHLAVPNLYRLAHGIVPVPSMLFSNFILLIQMLYGLGITLGPPTTAKFLHIFMGFLLVPTVIGFCRRRGVTQNAWPAAVLVLMIPVVGLNVTSAGIDVGWTFFTAAGVAALIFALETFSGTRLLLAALLMGAAGSCKFSALPLPWIGALLVGWEAGRQKKFGKVGLYIAAVMACQIPFMLRALLYHGNPVYPFLGTVWGHPRVAVENWQIFLTDSHATDFSKIFESVNALLQFFIRPWFVPLLGPSAGFHVSPIYLFFIPFVLFFRSRNKSWSQARFLFALFWLLWMFSNPTPRYGLHVVMLLVLCATEFDSEKGVAGLLRSSFLGVAFALALFNFSTVARYLYTTEGWKPALGKQSESAYLSQNHFLYPTPPYAALEWMNEHLPRDAKVVFAAEVRFYYLNRQAIPSGVHDPQPLVQAATESASGEEMAQKLRAQGITHLFFSAPEAQRVAGYGLFEWTEANRRVFGEFWAKSVDLLWSEDGLYVYALRSEENSRLAHVAPANPFVMTGFSLPSGT